MYIPHFSYPLSVNIPGGCKVQVERLGYSVPHLVFSQLRMSYSWACWYSWLEVAYWCSCKKKCLNFSEQSQRMIYPMQNTFLIGKSGSVLLLLMYNLKQGSHNFSPLSLRKSLGYTTSRLCYNASISKC